MQTRRWIFFAWLAAFYVAWATLVLVGDLWPTVASHWPIAASMAAGSYFAGSTPMGGGTVGFPVLVLLFDQPASMGRNFGFAVQSIGMVSASIYILSHRVPIDWRTLRAALPAAALTTPLCAALIAPRVPSALATLVYSVIVASFGLMHLARIRTVAACTRRRPSEREGRWLGLVAGCAGGLVASMTGVGIDMLVYIGMVAYARVDMRVAIPTSVILMAFTSLVGVGSNVALGSVDRAVFDNWLAAAPIVALGAPLGSIVVTYLSREKTLLVTFRPLRRAARLGPRLGGDHGAAPRRDAVGRRRAGRRLPRALPRRSARRAGCEPCSPSPVTPGARSGRENSLASLSASFWTSLRTWR